MGRTPSPIRWSNSPPSDCSCAPESSPEESDSRKRRIESTLVAAGAAVVVAAGAADAGAAVVAGVAAGVAAGAVAAAAAGAAEAAGLK